MTKTSISVLPSLMLLGLLILNACTKDSGTVNNTLAPSTPKGVNVSPQSQARYSGPDYSQSISVDSANALIGSYLSSVNYPYADTAIRSLTFDADTLRAYLQNSNIVTLKFMFAHQPLYKANNRGNYAGMNPTALTVVVVGQDDADNYILNNRGEVYEHMRPCPQECAGNSSATIY